jgi:hypothetical protein
VTKSRARTVVGAVVVSLASAVSFGAAQPLHAAGTATLWAVLGPDGRLSVGSGVVSTAHLGVGEYAVVFDKRVSSCAFNASAEDSSRIVATARLAGNAAGVLVRVWNSGGGFVDGGVGLQVSCGRKAQFAVVNSTGSLARGRHVLSTQSLGSGSYEVFFDRDISACALRATIGSVNTASPPPAFVAVALRAADHTLAFVQTSDLAGAGEDHAFHLALDCSGPNVLVATDGTLVRGSDVIESHWDTVDQLYVVTFDRDISACSWVATIGDWISRGVPAPEPVDVGPNLRTGDPRSVWVLVGGGHQQGPFHLVVRC